MESVSKNLIKIFPISISITIGPIIGGSGTFSVSLIFIKSLVKPIFVQAQCFSTFINIVTCYFAEASVLPGDTFLQFLVYRSKANYSSSWFKYKKLLDISKRFFILPSFPILPQSWHFRLIWYQHFRSGNSSIMYLKVQFCFLFARVWTVYTFLPKILVLQKNLSFWWKKWHILAYLQLHQGRILLIS